MEKQIKQLILKYKREQMKLSAFKKADIKRGDWNAVIKNEAADSFYDMVLSDLEKLVK